MLSSQVDATHIGDCEMWSPPLDLELDRDSITCRLKVIVAHTRVVPLAEGAQPLCV